MNFGSSKAIGFAAVGAVLSCMQVVAPAVARDRTEYKASGTWLSSADGAQPGTWTAILTRNGDQLTGTMSVQGAAAINDATIDGIMHDNTIGFGIAQSSVNWAYFRGSVDGDSLAGTYTFSAFNDSGTWKGTLTIGGDQKSASAE